MNNRTRLSRLRKLVEMLRDHKKLFPDIMFNMDTFGCPASVSNREPKNAKCITAACALGSAACYKPFNRLGLHNGGSGSFIIPRYDGASDFGAGMKFFGITMEESYYLFNPPQYNVGSRDISPKDVARRVDGLIKQYEKAVS